MNNNSEHDVFISYEHTSRQIVETIVAHLESHQIRCWYAPRDVRGGYAGSIMRAIAGCRVFVLILDLRSSNSPQVLNEVEGAYGRVMTDGLPIIPFRLDEQELNPEMLYYVKRINWIDAFNNGVDKAIGDLTNQLFELMPDRKNAFEKTQATGNMSADRKETNRRENRFSELFGEVAADEKRRRHMQHLILKEYDQPVYDRIFEDCSEGITVLDVGCDNGEVLHDRIGSRAEVSNILGIDANDALLSKARETFASDSRYEFAQCDFETHELEDTLRDYLEQHSLQGFDLVNITMVIMDLSKPYVVLRTIRRFLNDGGRIFIRDIDDGLNLAYPDHNNNFKKLNELCFSLPTTGFRTSGRQIFNMLKRAGYKDIRLESSGLSTVGMDHDRRYALFMTCFGWLGRGLRERLETEPDNAQYQEDLTWFEESIDDLEESFQDPAFFYQEGFMIYTARSYRRAF